MTPGVFCRAADLDDGTDRAFEREANLFAAELLVLENVAGVAFAYGLEVAKPWLRCSSTTCSPPGRSPTASPSGRSTTPATGAPATTAASSSTCKNHNPPEQPVLGVSPWNVVPSGPPWRLGVSEPFSRQGGSG